MMHRPGMTGRSTVLLLMAETRMMNHDIHAIYAPHSVFFFCFYIVRVLICGFSSICVIFQVLTRHVCLVRNTTSHQGSQQYPNSRPRSSPKHITSHPPTITLLQVANFNSGSEFVYSLFLSLLFASLSLRFKRPLHFVSRPPLSNSAGIWGHHIPKNQKVIGRNLRK
jgi:hypothetical protein